MKDSKSIKTSNFKVKKKRPRIVSHRGRGHLKLRLALWYIRRGFNRVHVIGYRLYPVYIFGMGMCFGLFIPPYIFHTDAVLSNKTLIAIFMIFFIPFIYYTYRWLRWSYLRKRAFMAMYATNNRSRRNRGVVYRVQRRNYNLR